MGAADKTISRTFLRISDGEFVTQKLNVRDDLVALPSGTMVVNQFMQRQDYQDGVSAFGRLSDPGARRAYTQLASLFVSDRENYHARAAELPQEALKAFKIAGLNLDHTHLRAVHDHVSNGGKAARERVIEVGLTKMTESQCTFINLSTHLGGMNMFEASRVNNIFKDAAKGNGNASDSPERLAKMIEKASKIEAPAATRAAERFIANPAVVI